MNERAGTGAVHGTAEKVPSHASGMGGNGTAVRLRAERVVLRPHGDGLLVYEFMIGGFYVLNSAARLIVDTIGDGRTVSDIAGRVSTASRGAVSAEDVEELLAELAEIHVVELLEVGRE